MKKLFTILFTLSLVMAGSAPLFSQETGRALRIEQMSIDSKQGDLNNQLSPVNIVKEDQIFVQNDDPRATVTVLPNNNSTSQNSRAPSSGFGFQRCYYYITAAEMAASGFTTSSVNSIGFNYSLGVATTGTFTVWFQTAPTFVDKGTNWNAALTGMTMAGSGPISLPAAVGTIDIPVSPGFNYTSGQGLWVAWQYVRTTGTGFNTALCNTLNTTVGILRNSQDNDSLRVIQNSVSTFRPETRLGNSLVDAVSAGPIYSIGEMTVCPCLDSNLLYVNVFHLEAVLDTIIIKTTIKNAVGGATKFIFEDTVVSNTVTRYIAGYLYPKPDASSKTDSIITVATVKRSENITGNNRATATKKMTLNRWNNAAPTGVVDGGVGTTNPGIMAAGFYAACPLPIYAVNLAFNSFTTGNIPFRVRIYGSDNDTVKPGALLFESPDMNTPAGTGVKRTTYRLPTPITVPGNQYYFVGLVQPQTATVGNMAVAYQTENPIRFGTYFIDNINTNTWSDFAAIGANFRLDIAAVTSADLEVKAFVEGFYLGNGMTRTGNLKMRVRSAATKLVVDSSVVPMNSTGVAVFKLINVNSDSSYYWDLTSPCAVFVWSRLTQKFDICDKQYNFSDALNKAYTNGFSPPMVQYPNDVSAPVFALYTGDSDQDGCLSANDISLIDNDVFAFDYHVNTDVNGDGTVSALDLALADNNVTNFVCGQNP